MSSSEVGNRYTWKFLVGIRETRETCETKYKLCYRNDQRNFYHDRDFTSKYLYLLAVLFHYQTNFQIQLKTRRQL